MLVVSSTFIAEAASKDSLLAEKNKIENEYIRELGSFHEQLEKYAIYLKQASKLYQKLETTFRYKK